MISVYLRESAVLVTPPPKDSWGEPVGSPVETPIQCKLRWKTRRVRSLHGEDVMAAGSVILKNKPAHDARIRVDGADWPILAIDSISGWRAAYYEVFFG